MTRVVKDSGVRRHLTPRHKVWLNWDGLFLMGPNYLRFLAAVDETGTIREGGRAVGWSYRTCLNRLRRMERATQRGYVGVDCLLRKAPVRSLRLALLVLSGAGLSLIPRTGVGQSAPSSPVKLSGYLQAREVYQTKIGLTSSINRARLAASGTIIEAVTWRIQGEFRTGSPGTGKASVALQDGYVRYAPRSWALQIGQFKTPFTREYYTSITDIETADRSTVVDSLAPKRDIGVMGEYTYRKVSLWAGVFNGEGQNVTANVDSTMLGVGRVAVRVLPELSLGVNGARYFGDSTRYGVDAAYQGSRLTLKGEYIGQARDAGTGPDDWGWYSMAAILVIPAVQAVAKYEEFGRPSITTAVKSRAWTAGLNLYPDGRNLRLTFDYVSRRIGEPGLRKGRLLAQVQARF